MQIIQYTEEMNTKVYNFFQKVFKENARDFSPLGKDSDILNILENYITDCIYRPDRAHCTAL